MVRKSVRLFTGWRLKENHYTFTLRYVSASLCLVVVGCSATRNPTSEFVPTVTSLSEKKDIQYRECAEYAADDFQQAFNKGFWLSGKRERYEDDFDFGSSIFGLHGEWCGPGRPVEGEKPEPVDDLDAACMDHDYCYEKFLYGRCHCDLKLLLDLEEQAKNEKNKISCRLNGEVVRIAHPSYDLIADHFLGAACKRGCREVCILSRDSIIPPPIKLNKESLGVMGESVSESMSNR